MATGAIIDIAVPVAVFVMMFALGLGLAITDFRYALKRPRGLLLGLASQIVLVPIAGFVFVAAQNHGLNLARTGRNATTYFRFGCADMGA